MLSTTFRVGYLDASLRRLIGRQRANALFQIVNGLELHIGGLSLIEARASGRLN
jgi:hypothetical protein